MVATKKTNLLSLVLFSCRADEIEPRCGRGRHLLRTDVGPRLHDDGRVQQELHEGLEEGRELTHSLYTQVTPNFTISLSQTENFTVDINICFGLK